MFDNPGASDLPSLRATLKPTGSSTHTRISPADFDSSRTNSSASKILWRASSSSSYSSKSSVIPPLPPRSDFVRSLPSVASCLTLGHTSCSWSLFVRPSDSSAYDDVGNKVQAATSAYCNPAANANQSNRPISMFVCFLVLILLNSPFCTFICNPCL